MIRWLIGLFQRPAVAVRAERPCLTPNFREGVEGDLWTCRYCRNFGGFDRDDPEDYNGKCDLQFDPDFEYGAHWISENMTCDAWEVDTDVQIVK